MAYDHNSLEDGLLHQKGNIPTYKFNSQTCPSYIKLTHAIYAAETISAAATVNCFYFTNSDKEISATEVINNLNDLTDFSISLKIPRTCHCVTINRYGKDKCKCSHSVGFDMNTTETNISECR